MKKIVKLCLFLLLAATIVVVTLKAVFHTIYIRPEGRGIDEYAPKQPLVCESEFVIRFTTKVSDLVRAGNSQIDRTFEGKENRELTRLIVDDWLSWNIRREDIGLTIGKDELNLNIPLAGSVSAGGNIKPLIGKIPIQETVRLTGAIKGSVSPTIASDWRPSPNLAFLLHLDRAEMVVPGARISVRGLIEDNVNAQAKKIGEEVSLKLVNQLRLKDYAARIWDRLHILQQFSESPTYWISVDPKEIAMVPWVYDSRNGTIIVTLGIKLVSRCFIQNEPPSPPEMKRLPSVSHRSTLPAVGRIRLPVWISDRILNQQLDSIMPVSLKALDLPGEITIISVSLANLNENTCVNVEFESGGGLFSRQLKGALRFNGMCQIDREKKKLSIVHLEHTIETKHVVPASLTWLLDEKIAHDLETMLTFEMTDILSDAQFKANDLLSKMRLGDDFQGTPVLSSLLVDGIEADRGGINVFLACDAETEIKVSFPNK